MFIIYYSLPTCSGRCCDHNPGTFTRILIKHKKLLVCACIFYLMMAE